MEDNMVKILGYQNVLAHLQSDASSFYEFFNSLTPPIYIDIINEWEEENVHNGFVILMVRACALTFDMPASMKDSIISCIVINAQVLFLSKLGLIDDYIFNEKGVGIEVSGTISIDDFKASLGNMRIEHAKLNEPDMPWLTLKAEQALIVLYEKILKN